MLANKLDVLANKVDDECVWNGGGGGNDVRCYLQTKMIDVNDIMRMWRFSNCCETAGKFVSKL